MNGEIECREGKFYFKDGDEVVAVFNEDKVCGVLRNLPLQPPVHSFQQVNGTGVFPPMVYPAFKEG